MGLKIYFCGSIRAGRQDAELYARLIKKLQAYGTVLTEHVGDDSQLGKCMSEMSDKEIHSLDMESLEGCDVVVAEVTQPSLGVGYEIGRAVDWKKKILCLFRPDSGKSLSAMIGGADNGTTFLVKNYEEKDADAIFKEFFSKTG